MKMNTRVIQGVSLIAVRSPQVSRDYPADARFPCNKAAVLGKTIQKHPALYKQEEEEERGGGEGGEEEGEEEEEKKKIVYFYR
jgi:hypothetical protein